MHSHDHQHTTNLLFVSIAITGIFIPISINNCFRLAFSGCEMVHNYLNNCNNCGYPYVLFQDLTKWSELALDAEYGNLEDIC